MQETSETNSKEQKNSSMEENCNERNACLNKSKSNGQKLAGATTLEETFSNDNSEKLDCAENSYIISAQRVPRNADLSLTLKNYQQITDSNGVETNAHNKQYVPTFQVKQTPSAARFSKPGIFYMPVMPLPYNVITGMVRITNGHPSFSTLHSLSCNGILPSQHLENDNGQISPNVSPMKDFVIINTERDDKEASQYRDHLKQDIPIDPPLQVELFSDIDCEKTNFQSLETLTDNYNYVLIFVTENLKKDKKTRFYQQILIIFGLTNPNGKQDRVVPVWACPDKESIIELSIIKGLDYTKFLSSSDTFKKTYVQQVQSTVMHGRQRRC